jgi:hypothetical protein
VDKKEFVRSALKMNAMVTMIFDHCAETSMNRCEYISDKKKYVIELIEVMSLYKGIHEAIDGHTVVMRKTLVDKKDARGTDSSL